MKLVGGLANENISGKYRPVPVASPAVIGTGQDWMRVQASSPSEDWRWVLTGACRRYRAFGYTVSRLGGLGLVNGQQ